MKNQKVAIVHDWLIGGGAEQVVEALHKMYPDAPIYTSYANNAWRKRLNNQVKTGYLQHWPFSKLRKFIPFLRILWFQSLNLSNYNLVISSSGAEAKGIKTNSNTLHINYCHAPTHYYWSRYDKYLKNPGFGILDPLARFGLKLLIKPLRQWDYKASQRPDKIISNSTFTQQQVKKYYQRDSSVIFPPVEIKKFKPSTKQKRYGFVIAGRQTPYKRFDLAIKACTKLNLPLLVIGDGPAHNHLEQLAGPSITFKTKVNDQDLVKAFQSSKGFIFPGVDDFGIVAVEALASGCPVVAFKKGGALDYIKSDKNGAFFEQPTVDSLAKALEIFTKKKYKPIDVVNSAKEFSPKIFASLMKQEIDKNYEK